MEHLILQILAAIVAGYGLFALTMACGSSLALRIGLSVDEAGLLPVQYLFGMLVVSVAAFASLYGWIGLLPALAFLAFLLHGARHPAAAVIAGLRDGTRCAPLAALLGLWVGLLYHAPSSTIGGSPMGDIAYYAVRAFYMAQHPVNTADFFAEGYRSTLLPAPHIPPVLAAALARLDLVDPFLFLVVSMTASMTLWLGAILGQGFRDGLSPRTAERTYWPTLLSAVALAAGSPGYLHWIFESAPVSVVLPLAALPVALLSQLQPSLRLVLFVTLGWLLFLLVSKVTALSFLATALVYPLVVALRRLGPRITLVVLALLAAALAGIWFLLTGRYQAYMTNIGMNHFSPVPDFIRNWGHTGNLQHLVSGIAAISSILLVVLAVRLETQHRWRLGLLLPCVSGMLLMLFLPSVATISYCMAMMMLAVSLAANVRRLGRFDMLLCVAVALGYVARDYSGGNGMRGLLSEALFAAALAAPLLAGASSRATAKGFLVYAPGALFFLVVGAGLLFRPLQARAEQRVHWLYSTDLHDVWQAVDRLTPQDSLIFTDQTGPQITQTEGWNAYPAMGRRQVFMSNWSEVLSLAVRPDRVTARLRQNQDLLLGRLPLRAVPLSRHYSAYFAVVGTGKRVLGPVLYANAHYRLYRIACGAL